MKKFKLVSQIVYLIISILTILEFIFVKGLFTSFIVMGLVIIFGIINAILEIKEKNIIYSLNYIFMSIALCMGYISIM